jgi:hypothetical protein
MKTALKYLRAAAIGAAALVILGGCDNLTGGEMTSGKWAAAELTTENSVNYHKFTASAGTQYVFIEYPASSTLRNTWVSLCNSDKEPITDRIQLRDWTGIYGGSTSVPVEPGKKYYIRVRPVGSNTGDYRIAFNSTGYWP